MTSIVLCSPFDNRLINVLKCLREEIRIPQLKLRKVHASYLNNYKFVYDFTFLSLKAHHQMITRTS